jgi:hypothetical protein
MCFSSFIAYLIDEHVFSLICMYRDPMVSHDLDLRKTEKGKAQ